MPDPEFLAGEPLSASKLQRLGDDDTYTPALTASTTDPDLGTTPTEAGFVWLNGQLVTLVVDIVFGTSPTAGSGTYRISIPAAYPLAAGQPDHAIGQFRLIDSGSTEALAIAIIDGANDRFELRTTDNDALVTNAAPWTWAAGDALKGMVQYLTDFT